MAERMTDMRNGSILTIKLAASTKVEAGKMAALNTTGYGVEASDATTVSIVMGRWEETVDNSAGSNGDLLARCRTSREMLFKWDNHDTTGTGTIGMANLGAVCYVHDDMTVSVSTGTAAIKAGMALGLDDDGKVWVDHSVRA